MKSSVVIATHARPLALTQLLENLRPQLESPDRELLIAENGTQRPSTLPEGFVNLTHLHDPRAGKCRIQNRAIVRARGDIVVLLDDDLIACDGYLNEVERFFDGQPRFAAMKGRVLAAEDPSRRVGASSVYLDLPIVDHGGEVIEVDGVMGANMAFRRAVFERVGMFDERLGPGAAGHEEETEMSARMRAAGFRIGYAPRAVVYHEVDPGRASRERFLRIARERGRCRMLHERHSHAEILVKNLIGALRLGLARAVHANLERIAREEKRLAIARGMRDELRK